MAGLYGTPIMPPEPSVDDLRDQLSDAHQRIFDLQRSLDDAQDDAWELRELLKDVLDCEAEFDAIGGGPGFKARRAKAYAAAWERFEP